MWMFADMRDNGKMQKKTAQAHSRGLTDAGEVGEEQVDCLENLLYAPLKATVCKAAEKLFGGEQIHGRMERGRHGWQWKFHMD